MKNLGYILVINNYYPNESNLDDLNTLFVPFINEHDQLLKYIDPIALDSLEINLSKNNKEADKLQNLLNHYHFGKGNPVIMNKIVKSLPAVPLNAQHIMSLRRLILDQQIKLDRPGIKKMFKSEKRLESVFQSATLFLDEETNVTTDNFVAENYS